MSSSKELKLNVTKDKKLLVSCGECRRKTNHTVLVSVDLSGTDEIGSGYEVHWASNHQIIQCQGCDIISFRRVNSTSEDDYIQIGPNEWEQDIHEELYPNRTEGRVPIKDIHLLPTDIERIYAETLKAMNGGQPVLSGIGIRALIETTTKERNANGKDLMEKINDLVTQGVLTKDGAHILHKLRILGNKAAHEVKPHSTDQLDLAMDVIEHLLQGVYILPHHAKRKLK
ncbi:MAG TPA: DUF4145 domain-containing protein [Candidatus Macondimonas sp.]|nr:DUF4145 domain-containing protein [Candidatus Macondimonas sp.]